MTLIFQNYPNELPWFWPWSLRPFNRIYTEQLTYSAHPALLWIKYLKMVRVTRHVVLSSLWSTISFQYIPKLTTQLLCCSIPCLSKNCNMRSGYIYQKVESLEECLGFLCSLNNRLMSIWISTLLASSKIARMPSIQLKRWVASFDVSNDLFFGNCFDTSITKAVWRYRCPGVGAFASSRLKSPSPHFMALFLSKP
jgi:hypothetical protein